MRRIYQEDYLDLRNGTLINEGTIIDVQNNSMVIKDNIGKFHLKHLNGKLLNLSENLIQGDSIKLFPSGGACIYNYGYNSLINSNGEMILPSHFRDIRQLTFNNRTYYEYESFVNSADIYIYGIIDEQGNQILKRQLLSDMKYRANYVFENGDIILDSIDPYNHYLINDDNKKEYIKRCSVIDENNWIIKAGGRYYIENRFTKEKKLFYLDNLPDYIDHFENGLARTKINNLWGLIDEQGKTILKNEYNYIDKIDGDLVLYTEKIKLTNEFAHYQTSFKGQGVSNTKGEKIIDIKYNANDNSYYYVLNTWVDGEPNEQFLAPLNHDISLDLDIKDNLILVKVHNSTINYEIYCVIDKDGNTVVPFVYSDNFHIINNNYAIINDILINIQDIKKIYSLIVSLYRTSYTGYYDSIKNLIDDLKTCSDPILFRYHHSKNRIDIPDIPSQHILSQCDVYGKTGKLIEKKVL